ncbi:hypothetical protein RDI58_018833 [Solanum bulbocastanum]|uniref:BHLH domain-containing protein n=1 Tax=Solanum bulbocastanum TaxID=147425 RepID=A0AAN8TIT3_SOLBU
MDDLEFDFGQLDQLLDFFSSPPPSPCSTSTFHQKHDSSIISLQTQNSNDEKKSIITTTIIDDDRIQDPPKEKEKKKIIRKDVEKQRRRDMAKLYQRLRLLIPSKYLMGKRAISDHLEEIVDYVKDLKENIEDLVRKREKLKNIIYSDDDEDKIIVKLCNGGVEISIKGGLPLSKVLKVLMKEGLMVNSCVSSIVDQSLHHIIQSKVNTRGNFDLAMLQSKLMSLS